MHTQHFARFPKTSVQQIFKYEVPILFLIKIIALQIFKEIVSRGGGGGGGEEEFMSILTKYGVSLREYISQLNAKVSKNNNDLVKEVKFCIST